MLLQLFRKWKLGDDVTLAKDLHTAKCAQANESSQGRGSTMFIGANAQPDTGVNVPQTDTQI